MHDAAARARLLPTAILNFKRIRAQSHLFNGPGRPDRNRIRSVDMIDSLVARQSARAYVGCGTGREATDPARASAVRAAARRTGMM